MKFSTTLIVAAFTTLVSAQNPFNFNTIPQVTAGTPFEITWSPSTGTTDTVTILLREGNTTQLTTVMTIASHIQNVGSYAWAPPSTLLPGSTYTFEIIDDGNTAIVNYSLQFTISSQYTASTPVATATASSTATSSSATATATATKNAGGVERSVNMGGSMLAVVGAVMVAL